MSIAPPPAPHKTPWLSLLLGVVLLAAGVVTPVLLTLQASHQPQSKGERPQNIGQQIEAVCTACHAYPSPKNFPRWAWKTEIEQAYGFIADLKPELKPPPIEATINYFERRAPLELPPAVFTRSPTPYGVRFAVQEMPDAPKKDRVSVSNVQLVRLSKNGPLELIACEMRAGLILALRPNDPKPSWRILARVANPAHVEVVDLKQDGSFDLLVADLGNFLPTDELHGKVIWLRSDGKGNYTPHTLLEGVGRVADVRAAPFREKGKLDLIVGVFGWRKAGNVILLENHTAPNDWDHPKFIPRVIDDRHGSIHVPVADLNGDGLPDFVALFAQEHETVVAFINEGGGKFRKEVIYEAPDPSYGSSGIQLVDLDGDGRTDVLYTNGDVMDLPPLLKPFHGIRWLKNNGTYPYEHRLLTPMYGVHSAVAVDLGSGRKDILAVSFLPEGSFPHRKEKNLDSVVVLEQTAPGQFTRHTLESVTCDHVTCTVGDVYGTGRQDLVIGQFSSSDTTPVRIWKNLGQRPAGPPKK